MEITEIRISLRDDNKLKAFASITLDNCFVVRGLKIIEGAKGTFVAMPSRRVTGRRIRGRRRSRTSGRPRRWSTAGATCATRSAGTRRRAAG